MTEQQLNIVRRVLTSIFYNVPNLTLEEEFIAIAEGKNEVFEIKEIVSETQTPTEGISKFALFYDNIEIGDASNFPDIVEILVTNIARRRVNECLDDMATENLINKVMRENHEL